MRRSTFAFTTLALLSFVVAARPVAAASALAGTTSCALNDGGRMDFRPYLPFATSPPLNRIRVSVKETSAGCDASAVTGVPSGKTFGTANVVLKGRLPGGTDCGDFLSTVAFEKGKLSVKWEGVNDAGNRVSLGTSKTTLAGGSFDSGTGSFVMVSEPIVKGAFAGSTLKLTLELVDQDQYMESCSISGGGGYTAFVFGPPVNDNTWRIEVQ